MIFRIPIRNPEPDFDTFNKVLKGIKEPKKVHHYEWTSFKGTLITSDQGQTMTEAAIEKWLKSDGEQISKGDEILEIMTDKVTVTVEASASGTLKIKETEGETVPVHGVVGYIE